MATWHTNLAHVGDVPTHSGLHTATGTKKARSSGKRSKSIVKTRLKVLLVTVVVAIPAFLTGPIIWPPPADLGVEPTAGQIPFFLLLAVIEAITLSLGVSFLLFGFVPLRRALGGSSWRTWAAYLAIGWFLVSWWPHNNLHTHNGWICRVSSTSSTAST
jgi:hypothetical protein